MRWTRRFMEREQIDVQASTRAVESAHRFMEIAIELHRESIIAGVRQRLLRDENHFGRTLDQTFKPKGA